MTLTEQATQDAQAVTQAQTALTIATNRATTSAAALATMQPSVGMLADIESELAKLDSAASAILLETMAKLKALLNV
jgi:hypothetical protein